jgi:hypothetical protein
MNWAWPQAAVEEDVMAGPVNLFKYMSLDTARIVLASGRLRWSTPALLNDPFDMSFDLHLDVDARRVKALALNLFWADYLDDAVEPPSPGFAVWKAARASTGVRLDRAAFDAALGPEIERRIRDPRPLQAMHEGMQANLSRAKILCLTERPDNILMWAHYGQQHVGAVMRFTLMGDNNAFQTARPVAYAPAMPRLTDDEGLARLITGRPDDPKAVAQVQIYTKADVWSYEREWRLQFGFGRDRDAAHEDLPFGDELLTGLIMGCRMPREDRVILATLAKALNPDVDLMVGRPAARVFAIELETWDG